jgi:LacI family transcriptional regulator/LacI family repressor for deo operon, udp, cdd, tsx, nupC, and nupG
MPATLDDIVSRLGISRSTVSRALRNHPRISEQTRARVQEVAREVGYVPNEIARSLTNRRTRSLGMVIPHISDPFIWHVADGVEQVATERGYSVFLRQTRGDSTRELAIIEDFERRRVDGIVVQSSHLVAAYGERLRSNRIPVIVINAQVPSEHLVSVHIDDTAAAGVAVRYLLELGHTRIGYVGSGARPLSNQRRADGYADVLRAHGLQPLTIDITAGEAACDDFTYGQLVGGHMPASDVSAVFCYNDVVAAGVIAALHERHISVPAELSVMGFDDVDLAKYITPPLTTLRQPMFTLGHLAATTLLAMIEGQPVETTVLPCELVVRGSTTMYRPVA